MIVKRIVEAGRTLMSSWSPLEVSTESSFVVVIFIKRPVQEKSDQPIYIKLVRSDASIEECDLHISW